MRIFISFVLIFLFSFSLSIAQKQNNRMKNPLSPKRAISVYAGKGKSKRTISETKRMSKNKKFSKKLKKYSERARRHGIMHTIW
jgi:hypothetical protein